LLKRILIIFRRLLAILLLPTVLSLSSCSSIRITDPDHTADELYLENVASQLAVAQISANVLRGRLVYVDPYYLTSQLQSGSGRTPIFGQPYVKPTDQQQYLIGELRAKLLLTGVRLTDKRDDADIIMEVRSQGISVDHIEFLLGLPQSSIGGIFTGGIAGTTPEISIVKRTQQHGFSSIAFIAYWRTSGEVVASSGPFVGRTLRDDYWFLGYGPHTIGNIPPAEPAPSEAGSGPEQPAAKKPAEPAKPKAPPKPDAYSEKEH
jgi:hypothetical protein